MSEPISTNLVWQEIEKQIFGILGMVTAQNEARTVGIVYAVADRKLYIGSKRDAWKVRHIAQNPHVSLTIPIHKRIIFMPWIKIPAATITFSGKAAVKEVDDIPAPVVKALYQGMEVDELFKQNAAVIEMIPVKEFLTYGVGVSLMEMRAPEKARGRVPVNEPG
jgi:uncharacterized pyridoxamine 5'-phosphate oxidase family protein